jgi:hypothetical protein
MKHMFAAVAVTGWFALGGIALADDAGPITIPAIVNYADEATVPPAVRNECKLETELASWIKTYADELHVPVTVAISGSAKPTGRVLKVKISNVLGSGGGAYSGAKSVQVKGELREGDKVIGTFIGSRASGGGMFAGFKGTCSIMGRDVKVLGKDIVLWLKNPTMDARLGNG